MDHNRTEDHKCDYGLDGMSQQLSARVQAARSFSLLKDLSGQRRDEYATYTEAVRV